METTPSHIRTVGQGRRQAEDVEEDAGHGVDAGDLDEEAGQDGRDGRRGRRVGVREPGVERDEGRLEAEAQEEEGRGDADDGPGVELLEALRPRRRNPGCRSCRR